MKNWKRSGRIIGHHITNRSQVGRRTPQNILQFDSERERAWHFLFKNLSFEEVAELLLKTCQMKGRK